MRYCVYDLSISPSNYDIFTFLVVVKARGAECVYFRKGPNQGFKQPNKKPYSLEEQKFRLTHVLYPACSLMGMEYLTSSYYERLK